MTGALNLLLIACLLKGALCQEYKVITPKSIEVLNGSCVTIPCSFDIATKDAGGLDDTCKAIWKNKNNENVVFNSIEQRNGELRGILTEKDCTTTLNNIAPDNRHEYYFRLECDDLKFSFKKDSEEVNILVRADPPTPTLTPSTLKAKEGSLVSLTCSAPAPCLTQPPNLTWTSSLGDSQETLQEKPDKTKVKISVLTFTASHLHHGKEISCTATYVKQDGSTELANSRSLTLNISYSPKRTTVSVSPSGPVAENSVVTLTCSSTANPAVTNYTWYRADGGQETFMGTGAVLKIIVFKDSGHLFCKAENDLGAGRSNISQIDVQFAPQILSSSDCTKTAAQLNCSCETVGNPSPTLQWYLDGLPVNHSDKVAITNEPLNDRGLSLISVSQPQWRNLSTLLCRSSNSLGSATQRFYVYSLEPQTSGEFHECRGRAVLPIFVTTICVLTAVLICALLFVVRSRRTCCHNPTQSQCTGGTSTAVTSLGQTSEQRREVSITSEEDIYANTNIMRNSVEPNAHLRDQQVAEKNNEEGSDVIYTCVNWKSNAKKGKFSGDRNPSGAASSYLEEEMCTEVAVSRNFVSSAQEMGSLYDNILHGKDAKKEAHSEYAMVKFRDKNVPHK